MCVFKQPKVQAPPPLPPEYQQAKSPDEGEIRASKDARVRDKVRASQTILTSPRGLADYQDNSNVGYATLLGG